MATYISRLLFVIFIFVLNNCTMASFKHTRRMFGPQITTTATITESSKDSHESNNNGVTETSIVGKEASNEKDIAADNAKAKDRNGEANVESNVMYEETNNEAKESSYKANERNNEAEKNSNEVKKINNEAYDSNNETKGSINEVDESHKKSDESNNIPKEGSNGAKESNKTDIESKQEIVEENKKASEGSEIISESDNKSSGESTNDTRENAGNEAARDAFSGAHRRPAFDTKSSTIYTKISTVDEVGKQILDANADERYCCPCDKSAYDSLNVTKRKTTTHSVTYNNKTVDEHLEHQENTHYQNSKYHFTYDGAASKSSCAAIYINNLKSSSAYEYITLPDRPKFKVRCIPDARPECAWTVIMERKTENDNFNLNWKQYRKGFGDPSMDEAFFVGLENVYALTHYEDLQIHFHTHFESEDLENEIYQHFMLDDEKSDYEIIRLNAVSNNTMVRRLRLGSRFTTKDHDGGTGFSKCAKQLEMGWWYTQRCIHASSMSSIHAYVKSPTTMAVRNNHCG
ncbi:uncharacterized protein [Eurosta solidaginis]|uniref:uncharacterized protein n=1 Tax=Eurosta solidaginis TaxID=178769 RepID=UPI003531397A